MLNLKEVLAYLDDSSSPGIFRHQNDGDDRDLSGIQFHEMMNNAFEGNWYNTSIWVTGSDTMTWMQHVFSIPYDVKNGVRDPTITSLFGRPVMVMNVMKDTLSRVYLVNYGDGPVVGSVLKDLQ